MSMLRVPKPIIFNQQLTVALAGCEYPVPVNTWATISAALFNNTTITAQTITVHIVPSGGSATVANQIATAITVPPMGSAPTVVGALIGQHLNPGDKLTMLCSAAASVTPYVSAYLTTL